MKATHLAFHGFQKNIFEYQIDGNRQDLSDTTCFSPTACYAAYLSYKGAVTDRNQPRLCGNTFFDKVGKPRCNPASEFSLNASADAAQEVLCRCNGLCDAFK
jgi:hypothetical protein